MGDYLRSEEMGLYQLVIPSESAYVCISEIGEMGLVQFRDMNPNVNAFQRKFVNELRRCDEMLRKLRFVENEIEKDEIVLEKPRSTPEAPLPKEIINMEASFDKLESEIREVNVNSEALKKTYLELTELMHILSKTNQFFEEMQETGLGDESTQLLGEEGLRAGGQAQLKLGFVTGVILRERLPAFERMLWRVCHGNVFLRQAEIEKNLTDPITGDEETKSVFIIFFQGEQLKNRVKKICEGFRAVLYPCPETSPERRDMIERVATRIGDLNIILKETIEHRHRILSAASQKIYNWLIEVKKIKAIYHTLNMFSIDMMRNGMVAECWLPIKDSQEIDKALCRGKERSGARTAHLLTQIKTKESPPTFNRTNKFTKGYQELVDCYGVATYREVNPALFTLITFPFLFAVMFGDCGHGLIMFLIALYMVLKERQLEQVAAESEIFALIFGGRYIVLLMGLFSIYTGFIYNDIFSKSMNIFGSGYFMPNQTADNQSLPLMDEALQMISDENYYSQHPYIFGVDPVWQLSTNKILFLNSFKMKSSVLIGVTQMIFGLILSLVNHIHYNSMTNILCEFIPQMIFMFAIFGYMNLMIIVKWLAFSYKNSGIAPSILTTLINMFLFSGVKDNEALAINAGLQTVIQKLLVGIAVLCIPWILLVKPYIKKKDHERKMLTSPLIHGNVNPAHETDIGESRDSMVGDSNGVAVVDMNGVADTTGHGSGHGGGDHGDEEFHFDEIIIDQTIHTIEYVLGTVSHTASYLRLWALSLAHAQLSEVLWNMVMRIGVKSAGSEIMNVIFMFIAFAAWATLTIIILLLMEGLSAFLHTLRLHWVEFQSKFYHGSGYLFQPFSFKHVYDLKSED